MSFRSILPAALAVASQFHGANAWGDLGHETIGYIAENFVKSSTESYCKGILGISNSSYLASVATWADSWKYTSAGEFSKPFHFIDAQDSPPKSCNVDYSRDCGDEGCSISAMKNYTNQLLDSSTTKAEAVDALKLVVHIVGDIHQPLHDENLDVGGNDIDVTYDGESTNLHHIWDTNMPEQDAGGYWLSDAQKYASMLSDRIKTGQYESNSSSWLDGMDLSDPVSSSMIWASDANSYVCSTVFAPGMDYINSTDLSGDYYNTSQPVFEELIARAGFRLAKWLDLIADSAPSS